MNTEIKRPYRLIVRFETSDERERIFHLLRTHGFRGCERLDLTKPVSPQAPARSSFIPKRVPARMAWSPSSVPP